MGLPMPIPTHYLTYCHLVLAYGLSHRAPIPLLPSLFLRITSPITYLIGTYYLVTV